MAYTIDISEAPISYLDWATVNGVSQIQPLLPIAGVDEIHRVLTQGEKDIELGNGFIPTDIYGNKYDVFPRHLRNGINSAEKAKQVYGWFAAMPGSAYDIETGERYSRTLMENFLPVRNIHGLWEIIPGNTLKGISKDLFRVALDTMLVATLKEFSTVEHWQAMRLAFINADNLENLGLLTPEKLDFNGPLNVLRILNCQLTKELKPFRNGTQKSSFDRRLAMSQVVFEAAASRAIITGF